MPGYQSVSVIAAAPQTDEETLRGFRDKGWVDGVEKNSSAAPFGPSPREV